MNHNPDCDVNDHGPDGIKKPCNCTKPSTCGSIYMEEFMTPEAQRIAIAEACGWKFYCVNYFGDRVYHDPSGVVATDNPADKDHVLPYYLSDLNAMHEAESMAGLSVIKAMRGYLWLICDQMTAHHATAAQRAEAFLKAIGKWEKQ